MEEGDLSRFVYTLAGVVNPGEQTNLWPGDALSSQLYQFKEVIDGHKLVLFFY
jgi:hypothetical protein